MAWEWVSPTATAAVGIGVVGFAYLTSRHADDTRAQDSQSSRRHERDLIVRRERLEMFAAYLAAIDAFEAVLIDTNATMGRWHKDAHSPNDPLPEAFTTMIDSLSEMRRRYQAARLVGSAAVSDAGEAVDRNATEILRKITEPDTGWGLMRHGPRDDLLTAMREDLGNAD
jgi:hypothetical protein